MHHAAVTSTKTVCPASTSGPTIPGRHGCHSASILCADSPAIPAFLDVVKTAGGLTNSHSRTAEPSHDKERAHTRPIPAKPDRIRMMPTTTAAVIMSPAMTNKIEANQRPVPTSNNARPRFNQTIHGPGCGKTLIRPGASVITIHGIAKPMPRAIKIPNKAAVDPVSANPTATPTNGAEQGVARMVASMPVRKSPASSFRGDDAPVGDTVQRCAKAGTGRINRSSMDRTNTPISNIITVKNTGL